MEPRQFLVADVGADGRDAAQILRLGRYRVEQGIVVGAVHARRHHDQALDAERLVHGAKLAERRVRRRIGTVVLVGIARCRAEDVGVTIGGPSRYRETWRMRIGIGRGASGTSLLLMIGSIHIFQLRTWNLPVNAKGMLQWS